MMHTFSITPIKFISFDNITDMIIKVFIRRGLPWQNNLNSQIAVDKRMAQHQSLTRDPIIDFLRFTALIMVIIAHSEPPSWLFQIRNFDVPLLILTSAITYSYIYSNRPINMFGFYKSRIPKLVIPAWSFLTLFFLIVLTISWVEKTSFPYSLYDMRTSYSFYSGIGYVWILRIFLLISLITPPLIQMNHKIKSDKLYFGLIFLAYLFYEAFLVVLENSEIGEGKKTYLENGLLPLVPYTLIYALGLRLKALKIRQCLLLSISFGLIFSAIALGLYLENDEFIQTQTQKYPPTIYYVSYALFISLSMYCILKITPFNTLDRLPRYVSWISEKSLWIYLWHILYLYVWDMYFDNTQNALSISLAKALFVLCLSAITIFMQGRIINHCCEKSNSALPKWIQKTFS